MGSYLHTVPLCGVRGAVALWDLFYRDIKFICDTLPLRPNYLQRPCLWVTSHCELSWILGSHGHSAHRTGQTLEIREGSSWFLWQAGSYHGKDDAAWFWKLPRSFKDEDWVTPAGSLWTSLLLWSGCRVGVKGKWGAWAAAHEVLIKLWRASYNIQKWVSLIF